jgi:hypothetical protein
MRRRQLKPGGVDPFRTALALEELDLPREAAERMREAAERMREPKRHIVGTKRPRGLAILHVGSTPVAMGAVSCSMVNDRLTAGRPLPPA